MATPPTDIFSFVVHRGVQLVKPDLRRQWLVDAFPDGLTPAAKQAISGRAYYGFRRSAEYKTTLASEPMMALDEALRVIPGTWTAANVSDVIAKALKKPNVGTYVKSKEYRDWRERVAKCLLVTTYDPTALPEDHERSTLMRQMQLFGLIERVADGAIAGGESAREFLTYATVVLPKEAFVPQDGAAETETPPRAVPIDKPELEKLEKIPGPQEIVEALGEVQSAVGLIARTARSPRGRTSSDEFALSKTPASYLSKKARGIVRELVPQSQRMSLPDIANALEQKLAAVPAPALEVSGTAKAAKSRGALVASQHAAMGVVSPGMPPGLSRLPGVADLKVVRERLLRYEDGEVAHIENVMAKESRNRSHRLLKRDQETTTTETETERVTERDTQIAQRFELEQEATNTIASDSKVEAGLSITASYGSYFSATANVGYSSSTSQSQAQRAASKYARNVVDRSAARVREMVRTFRSRTTLTETEEVNTHGFSNTTSQHVVGVYRWVDKVLEAQVYNYGKRLMLEVMVPDPARYYRQRLAGAALPGVTRTPPPPLEVFAPEPGKPNATRPLSPADINVTNYLRLAAMYGAADVEPPPAMYRWAVDAWKEEKSQDPWAVMSARKDIEVDPGYAPVFFRAAVLFPTVAIRLKPNDDAGGADSVATIGATFTTKGTISVGGTQVALGAGGGVVAGSPLNGSQTNPAERLGVAIMVERQTSYACEISVLCIRTPEAYAQWQAAVYGSILRAFESRRSEYEAQVKSAKNDQIQIAGRNPLENESNIRIELKRAALTLLQQRQPPFVYNSIGVDQPPTIDLNASAAGTRIQFFEQACEWNQLVYVPYGYFWADTNDWNRLADQTDNDPRMQEFLRAGWARVVIPVRPVFTQAICFYLATGIIWNGDHVPQVNDPLYVSAVLEIQEADGIANGASEGSPWIVRLPTALSHLQPGPELPVLVAP